jgi:type IV pilus assembly protein PilP
LRINLKIDTATIREVAVCFGILFFLLACNSPEERTPGKTVVRKKIASSSKPSKNAPKQPAPPKEETVNAKNTKPGPASTNTPPPVKKAAAVKQENPPVAPVAKVEELIPDIISTPLYDSTGKIDPFRPLLKDKAEVARKKKIKRRTPRTPLERMDISQIKLVAVIRAPEGNIALLEEASGKGYIVSIGTYVGINGGRITGILKDRLIIREESENILGKVTIQKRELKLQKPPGEF